MGAFAGTQSSSSGMVFRILWACSRAQDAEARNTGAVENVAPDPVTPEIRCSGFAEHGTRGSDIVLLTIIGVGDVGFDGCHHEIFGGIREGFGRLVRL